MRLQPVVAELEAIRLAGKPAFRRVAGVLEYLSLAKLPPILPADFVVPEAEDAAANTLSTGIDQRVTLGFAVLIVVPAAVAANAVSDQLHELSEAVKLRLAGWKHPDASSPVAYAGGGPSGVAPDGMIWAVRFRFSQHLRKVR